MFLDMPAKLHVQSLQIGNVAEVSSLYHPKALTLGIQAQFWFVKSILQGNLPRVL